MCRLENFADRYQHRRHNKNLLMAHLILVTKYRKPSQVVIERYIENQG